MVKSPSRRITEYISEDKVACRNGGDRAQGSTRLCAAEAANCSSRGVCCGCAHGGLHRIVQYFSFLWNCRFDMFGVYNFPVVHDQDWILHDCDKE
jgi:hypothetical protein